MASRDLAPLRRSGPFLPFTASAATASLQALLTLLKSTASFRTPWALEINSANTGSGPLTHGPSELLTHLSERHMLSLFCGSVLSRWNMLFPTPVVSRVQCTVEVLPDGTCFLHSNGKNPTGVRSQGGPWGGLQKGQWRMLNNGDQISLDCTNPDAAVFVCQNMQQGPGGMQPGYPQ